MEVDSKKLPRENGGNDDEEDEYVSILSFVGVIML
jgi:hypothetical protein